MSTKSNLERRNRIETIQNRTIDQNLCILTIRNSERRNNKNKSQIYSDLLLNIKSSRYKDVSNEINKMIELNDWKKEMFKKFKNFEINRFYTVTNVIRSAHVHLQNRKTTANALQNRQPRQLIISLSQSWELMFRLFDNNDNNEIEQSLSI